MAGLLFPHERSALYDEKEYLHTLKQISYDIINGLSADIDALYVEMHLPGTSSSRKREIYNKIQDLKTRRDDEREVLRPIKLRLEQIRSLLEMDRFYRGR